MEIQQHSCWHLKQQLKNLGYSQVIKKLLPLCAVILYGAYLRDLSFFPPGPLTSMLCVAVHHRVFHISAKHEILMITCSGRTIASFSCEMSWHGMAWQLWQLSLYLSLSLSLSLSFRFAVKSSGNRLPIKCHYKIKVIPPSSPFPCDPTLQTMSHLRFHSISLGMLPLPVSSPLPSFMSSSLYRFLSAIS